MSLCWGLAYINTNELVHLSNEWKLRLLHFVSDWSPVFSVSCSVLPSVTYALRRQESRNLGEKGKLDTKEKWVQMKILCKGSTKEKGPGETNLFSPESWGKREKKSPAAREKLRKSFTHSFEISLSTFVYSHGWGSWKQEQGSICWLVGDSWVSKMLRALLCFVCLGFNAKGHGRWATWWCLAAA